MRSLLRILICFVLTTLPLAAAEVPTVRFAPHRFEPGDGSPVDAELGELKVPENRANPQSATVTLRFVRFRSTSAKPGSPIVYLAGGPGGSGIDAASGTRFPLFMALREHGDVIALDQRGTGRSEPDLDCDERYVIDPAAPLDRTAGSAVAEAVARCAARLRGKGIDPAAYTTRESAADLEDLRRALGVPKITLWGISYGTHLALAMLKDHGAGVDRVILAGVEGLDGTYKLPSDQQALLEEIARRTAADPATRQAVPDLLGSVRRLLADLEKQPRKAALVHPLLGQKVDLTLGKVNLQLVLAQMLTGPETFAAMPDLVARLERGDWTALALAVGRFLFDEAPRAMAVAMDCASGAGAARTRTIAEEAGRTLLGDTINIPFPEICAGLPVADLGDGFREPVRSDVPALLISGTLDGRTPPRNAEAVMPGLPNAVHLVIDGAGHSDPLFLSSPKILEAMQRFLRGEGIGEKRVAAAPFSFIAPRTVVDLPKEVLERYVGTYRISKDSTRKILKAGPLLFSMRDSGPPTPIRPTSPTEFFYEGSRSTAVFQVDAKGAVTGMTVKQDETSAAEPARKER